MSDKPAPISSDAAKKILLDVLKSEAERAVGQLLDEDLPVLETLAIEAAAAALRERQGDPTAAPDLQVIRATLASMAAIRTIGEAEHLKAVLLTTAEIGVRVLAGALAALA